jgi:hypothetical protein
LLYHFLVAPPLRQMWDPVIQKRELVQRVDPHNMIQRVVCTQCLGNIGTHCCCLVTADRRNIAVRDDRSL